MFRLLKWAAWVVGAFFVLITAGVIAVQVFLSSDEIIKIAEKEGRKLLGREVSIDRLELGLFKITAGGIAVGETNGKGEKAGAGGGRPFIRLAEVDVLWNPSALLYRRISVVQLTVRGASFRVRRNARGEFNFRDIIGHLNRPTKKTEQVRTGGLKIPFPFPASAEAARPAAQGAEPVFSFVIHELDLYDAAGEFRFDAGETAPAFHASCAFAHVEVDRIKPGEPLDVFLDGKCRRPGGPPLARLKGDARLDMSERRHRASLEIPLLDLSVVTALWPGAQNYRLRKGVFAGSAELDYAVGEPLVWDADLRGRAIRTDFRANREEKWRALRLAALTLRTKGRYVPLEGSARVESLIVETPFASVRLTKPSFWSVSGKDEVHAEANVGDMAEVGAWISAIAGVPVRGLGKNAAAEMTISATRDRRKPSGDVRVEAAARFDPLDLASLRSFSPFADYVSNVRGRAGGKAQAAFVSGESVRWNVDLNARGAAARVRVGGKRRWREARIDELALRSKGSFDLRNESARIDALEIEAPFAVVKLEKPARWNVAGEDEAALSVDVSDLSSLADLLARLDAASLEGFPDGTKMRFAAAASRNRKKTSGFRVDTEVRFAALPIAPFVRLAPLPAAMKKPRGRVSGALQVSVSPAGVVHWSADLSGKKIGASVGRTPAGKPRAVSLDSVGLRSKGVYRPSKGSLKVREFDLHLPFAKARLNRAAIWNEKDRDGFSLALDITDSRAADRWLGRLTASPVLFAPGGKELKILLSGTRNRKKSPRLSYKASASFDALRVAPLVELARLSPVLGGLNGEIAGKAAIAYVPQKSVAWNLDLESGDLGAEFAAPGARKRRGPRAGKIALKTAGSYDLRNQSARLRSFSLSAPFGRIRMPKPARWNVRGRDAGRFRWRLSSLEGAARLVGGIWGEPLSKLSVAGSADGWLSVSRNRKKTEAISTEWSAAARLDSLAHADYPNLKLAGEVSGRMSGGVVRIRAPELRMSDASRPNAPPDVVLRGLGASLSRAALMRGEMRSSSVRAKSLKIRYLYDVKRRSNFESLFKEANTEGRFLQGEGGRKDQAAPGVNPEAPPAPSKTKAAARESRRAGPEARGPLLPAIKIKKFEIQKMALHFEDEIAKNKTPVVLEIPAARVVVTNFDTRMAPNARKTRLELKTLGEAPAISVKASLNPGKTPPDVEGVFSLSRFDLRKISPYARGVEGESVSALLMRGTRITRGRLDFNSTYSLRNKQLKLKGRAKIIGLRLKPDGENPLNDIALKFIERTTLRPLKKSGDALSFNVSASGRVDDPEFHFLDAVVEPVFANLFDQVANLGSDVTNTLDEILGMAIEGVRKLAPGAKRGESKRGEGSGKEEAPRKGPFGTLGKGIEDVLRKGIESLFGVKNKKSE